MQFFRANNELNRTDLESVSALNFLLWHIIMHKRKLLFVRGFNTPTLASGLLILTTLHDEAVNIPISYAGEMGILNMQR